jgi:tRNA nucleotidyltransferase (CCA-adding enzyme)
MNIPKSIQILSDHLNQVGGRSFLVGGCIRDARLGFEPKDWDLEVYHLTPEILQDKLSELGKVIEVGKSFGVFKITMGNEELDIAVPREEKKTGPGHKNFEISPNPEMPLKEALSRRDFTINAIAYDITSGTTHDPYNGIADLENKILRPTSERFKEDPLRVLRGFQFAGRFGLECSPEFIRMAKEIHDSFNELAKERVWMEFSKWARKSSLPSKGLQALKDTGWIQHFPEIANLVECKQSPQWHPEGDVFIHTTHCCDELTKIDYYKNASGEEKEILMLTMLAHDFGKPKFTQFEDDGRITSHGHEAGGVKPLIQFLKSIKAPRYIKTAAIPLVNNHLAHASFKIDPPSTRSIQRLAKRLSPASITQLVCIMQADQNGRPPLPKIEPVGVRNIREVALKNNINERPPQRWIEGRDLINLGMEPGPKMGIMVNEIFNDQIDDKVKSQEEALELAKYKIKQSCIKLKTAHLDTQNV